MFQLKMKHKVRMKILDAWCIAPKSHTSGLWLRKEEGSFPDQMCWIRFLREYATTWAWAPISWLPSGRKWGQVSLFNISTCKGFLQCFYRALMWHNEGLCLWVIQSPFAGISPVRAFTLLSVHLLERRNYTQIRRVRVKGLLLMYSYFGSTSSFQRRGRGNWCVKINCGHKKPICQTACLSSWDCSTTTLLWRMPVSWGCFIIPFHFWGLWSVLCLGAAAVPAHPTLSWGRRAEPLSTGSWRWGESQSICSVCLGGGLAGHTRPVPLTRDPAVSVGFALFCCWY